MHRTYPSRGRAETLWLCGVVFALVCAGSGPALGDIIDVGVKASVSGSGTMTVECGVALINPPPGCVNVFMGLYEADVPLSFTSSTATPFGIEGDTTATFGFGSSFLGGNLLTTLNSPNPAGIPNLEAQLSDDASTSGAVNNFRASVSGKAAFTFDLTGETLMDVSTSGSGTSDGTLLGPMGLSLAIPAGGASVVLGPGSYELDETLSNSFSAEFDQFPSGGNFGSETVYASFQQVIPEPRWTFLAPVLLVVLWRRVSHRLFARHAV